MLVRFVLENMYSFGVQREFNMLPGARLRKLDHHKYDFQNLEVLKMASIYGANGSGKSNLVKSLEFLQELVVDENIPKNWPSTRFKFHESFDKQEQLIGIEFFISNKPYYYAILHADGVILTEELYESGLGKVGDSLVFERRSFGEKNSISFSKDFEQDSEGKVLKKVIEKSIIKPNMSVLKFLSTTDSMVMEDTKNAYSWFTDTLQIIAPTSRPRGLALRIGEEEDFRIYAENLMCALNLGITGLRTKQQKIGEMLSDVAKGNFDKIINEIESSPKKAIEIGLPNGEGVVLRKVGEEFVSQHIEIEHTTINGRSAMFSVDEESDGTIRLLDFVPAIRNLALKEKVYIVDEIERSIHPLLIKELVKKFSEDRESKGQLIFTTHESNLLDQEIFRQDEIWFSEKDKLGCSDLYSLSDFKEHNTIDIRKGYLNGRYGAVPFLSNLHDLKWHKDVAQV